MTRNRTSWFVTLGLISTILLLSSDSFSQADDKILVFSKTSGFRHGSISSGINLIQTLGIDNGFDVDLTQNSRDFTEENLSQYDAVVWLNTTGNVLSRQQQSAFESFIQEGGGYVGVHSAADTEYGWPWYGDLIGGDAWFRNHPRQQTALMDVEDHSHPSTQHLSETWSHFDEWYNFRSNPRGDVNVLLSVREDSYDPGPGAMGDHPVAWYHDFDGGRAWYTSLGHGSATYNDSIFQEHLLGGILYAIPEPESSSLAIIGLVLLCLQRSRTRRCGGRESR